jgi:hypothetical protein
LQIWISRRPGRARNHVDVLASNLGEDHPRTQRRKNNQQTTDEHDAFLQNQGQHLLFKCFYTEKRRADLPLRHTMLEKFTLDVSDSTPPATNAFNGSCVLAHFTFPHKTGLQIFFRSYFIVNRILIKRAKITRFAVSANRSGEERVCKIQLWWYALRVFLTMSKLR